jgi:hypothetical protein
MKFFVPDNIYKERISICKSCKHYLSILGNCGICKCFMSVKARLAPMECADNPKKWEKTKTIETPKQLPQDIMNEIIQLWPDIKTGKAKDNKAKNKLVEIYNVIHNTNYNINTNCRSCLHACFTAIQHIYNKYNK